MNKKGIKKDKLKRILPPRNGSDLKLKLLLSSSKYFFLKHQHVGLPESWMSAAASLQ